MGMQFVFALIILRTPQGFTVFKFIGDTVARFLDYTDVGSAFVFGNEFASHYIAFKVLKRTGCKDPKETLACKSVVISARQP